MSGLDSLIDEILGISPYADLSDSRVRRIVASRVANVTGKHVVELSITERRDLVSWLHTLSGTLILGGGRIAFNLGPERSVIVTTVSPESCATERDSEGK